MKKLIAAMLFALALCSAQDSTKPPDVRLVKLKYTPASEAERLLQVFTPGSVKMFFARNGLISISGPPDAIAIVEDFIRKFDVPPPPEKNIDVTAFMLLGSQQEGADPAVPELAGVLKQLRAVFGFKSYRLLETMVVRARENRGAEASGLMDPAQGGADASLKPLYQFKFNKATVSADEKGRNVHLDQMRFGGRIPIATSTKGGETQFQYLDTGINTDVDLREGQKVVVGKASIGTPNTSLFLVLAAKVVE